MDLMTEFSVKSFAKNWWSTWKIEVIYQLRTVQGIRNSTNIVNVQVDLVNLPAAMNYRPEIFFNVMEIPPDSQ